MKKEILSKLNQRLYYNGKCNNYDDNGELLSSLFRDASHMAYITDEDREDLLN